MLTNYTTGATFAAVSDSPEQAHRIIAAVRKGVKRDQVCPMLSWSEVLQHHKSMRGIGPNSLLVDRGESGYRNVFLADGRILYPGEGLAGNQQPTRGNAILLQALYEKRPMQVFCREATNRWLDLGMYRVENVEYRLEEIENRYVYWFSLKPIADSSALNAIADQT